MTKGTVQDVFLLIGAWIYVVVLGAWATEYPATYSTKPKGPDQQGSSETRHRGLRTWMTSQRIRNEEAAIVRVVWLDAGIPRERLSQGSPGRTPSTFRSISGAELSDWL